MNVLTPFDCFLAVSTKWEFSICLSTLFYFKQHSVVLRIDLIPAFLESRCFLESAKPAADLEFPRRGRCLAQRWGAKLLFGQFFPKTSLKMKGIGPRGARVPVAPPFRSVIANCKNLLQHLGNLAECSSVYCVPPSPQYTVSKIVTVLNAFTHSVLKETFSVTRPRCLRPGFGWKLATFSGFWGIHMWFKVGYPVDRHHRH